MEEVKYNEGDNGGVIKLYLDGASVGKLTFLTKNTDLVTFNHTEVEPDYEGKGYGAKLVKLGVGYARKNGYKVIPSCSFVKKEFDNTPAYNDVIFTT